MFWGWFFTLTNEWHLTSDHIFQVNLLHDDFTGIMGVHIERTTVDQSAAVCDVHAVISNLVGCEIYAILSADTFNGERNGTARGSGDGDLNVCVRRAMRIDIESDVLVQRCVLQVLCLDSHAAAVDDLHLERWARNHAVVKLDVDGVYWGVAWCEGELVDGGGFLCGVAADQLTCAITDLDLEGALASAATVSWRRRKNRCRFKKKNLMFFPA